MFHAGRCNDEGSMDLNLTSTFDDRCLGQIYYDKQHIKALTFTRIQKCHQDSNLNDCIIIVSSDDGEVFPKICPSGIKKSETHALCTFLG